MEIGREDEEAYRIIGGRADSGVIVICDHARNTVPEEYADLGLPAEQFCRHIAYDIGAESIAERIGAALCAPVVLSKFSRLLIDINRGEDDPTLVMRLSDGAIIPGNRHVDELEVARRLERFWRPYHAAVAATIQRCRATGVTPVILSIHSMTHCFKGVQRPWPISVLWDGGDHRLAGQLLDHFRAEPGLLVGDNEPYHGALEGDTLWKHARGNGLAGAIIEYRQDLVADEAGQAYWADRTVAVMRAILQVQATETVRAAE
ncbi:MAG TPA: N-formylglutamate amidohydrolase [Hyphomicrobiaceae bacterium]|nr:N-formylglutamate amidohydrolase [Hyphomicrobiaceae bacterium]